MITMASVSSSIYRAIFVACIFRPSGNCSPTLFASIELILRITLSKSISYIDILIFDCAFDNYLAVNDIQFDDGQHVHSGFLFDYFLTVALVDDGNYGF